MTRARGGVAVALLLGAATAAAAEEPVIGTLTTVSSGQAKVAPLRAGADAKVTTGPGEKAQLILLDGTAVTVAPGGEAKVEDFVYDPASGKGKLAMTGQGTFRVVGGKISKSDEVTFRTPAATIGIRGGVALIAPGAATFLYGDGMSVTGEGGERVDVSRRGFGVALGAGGPGAPAPADSGALGGVLALLEGSGALGSGAPSDGQAAQSGIGAVGSGNAPGSIGPQPPFAGPPPAPPPADNLTRTAQQTGMGTSGAAPPSATIGAPSSSGGGSGGAASLLAGRLKVTSPTDGAQGTADADPTRNLSVANGQLGSQFLAQIGGSAFRAPAGSGLFTVAGGATSPFGAFSGTGFVAPGRDFVFYEGTLAGGGDQLFLFAGVPTPKTALPTSGVGAFSLRADSTLGAGLPFLAGLAPALGAGAVISSLYINWDAHGGTAPRPLLQASLDINGTGPSQTSSISLLIGQLSGAGQGNGQIDAAFRGSYRSVGTAAFASGGAQLSTDAAGNGLFGSDTPRYLVLESPPPTGVGLLGGTPQPSFPNIVGSVVDPGTAGTQRSAAVLSGFLDGMAQVTSGGITAFQSAEPDGLTFSSFVTKPENNALTGSGSIKLNGVPLTVAFGGSGRGAFIDDRLFAAREAQGNAVKINGAAVDGQAYLVSADLVGAGSQLPGGVAACTCSFMRWGFWGVDTVDGSGNRTRVHLGQFVVGSVTVTPPTSGGTAVYNGHAVGDVYNGGAVYKAAGTLTVSYTFGTSSGTLQISNFDNHTYNATLGAPSGSGQITGALSSGPVSGTVVASFFSDGGNPVAGIGGQFRAAGLSNTYRVNGVLLGQQ